MDYLDNVWRSFRISWRHKYLWLIALFSGEGGGTANFNYNAGNTGRTGRPDLTTVQDQVTRFIQDYAALLIALAVLWLVLVVVFFFLAAVCEGATIRSSAEHDADRPWGLRFGWRAGVLTMWPMIRFRLLLLALGLPVFLLFIGFTVGIIASAYNNNGGLALGLTLLGVVLLLPVIAYLIYLSFLDRFGTRALVLEQLGARASIVRAHRLLLKRFGRSLLVLLIAVAVAIVVGIATACVFSIVAIPLVLVGVLIMASNSAAVIPVILVWFLVLLPISLVVGGFLAAQGSTYWTLAFRRMEIDRPPVVYQPYFPPAAPPAAPPA